MSAGHRNGTQGEKRFDSAFLASLRSRLPDYLAACGVALQPKGSRLVGHCPMHDDRSPSFAVFGRNNEMAGCYPCGFNGDVFKVSLWLGRATRFSEAVRDVASVLGAALDVPFRPVVRVKIPSPPPTKSFPPEEPPNLPEGFEDAHRAARTNLYRACRSRTMNAIGTARELGTNLETLRSLTFTSDAVGIEDGAILYLYETGAKIRRPKGSTPRFIWAHGRALYPWRWHFAARPEIMTVILTEGESDAVACLTAGLENLHPKDGRSGQAVVACPGTSFPERWGQLFRGKHVILLFDFDEAGRKGARRAAAIIRPHALSVRIAGGRENE